MRRLYLVCIASLSLLLSSCGGSGGGGLLPPSPGAPGPIASPATATIVGGAGHSLALDAGQTLRAWGAGSQGQLGTGLTTSEPYPTVVTPRGGVRLAYVASSDQHSIGLTSRGEMWVWGDNQHGQLGTGSTTSRRLPTEARLPTGTRFSQIVTAATYALAIDGEGNLWSWGEGRDGQLGLSDVTSRTQPTKISVPIPVRFVDVAAGTTHAIAVDSVGDVWTWGRGAEGQLGYGGVEPRSVPTRVSAPQGIRFNEVEAGDYSSYALDTSGQAWAWGYGQSGELGNGRFENRYSPDRVVMPRSGTFETIRAAKSHVVVLDDDGDAWAWGAGGYGQLGNRMRRSSNIPVPVDMPSAVKFTEIGVGESHTLAKDASGNVYAWGRGIENQLGDARATSWDAPIRVNLR